MGSCTGKGQTFLQPHQPQKQPCKADACSESKGTDCTCGQKGSHLFISVYLCLSCTPLLQVRFQPEVFMNLFSQQWAYCKIKVLHRLTEGLVNDSHCESFLKYFIHSFVFTWGAGSSPLRRTTSKRPALSRSDFLETR